MCYKNYDCDDLSCIMCILKKDCEKESAKNGELEKENGLDVEA